MQKSAAPVPAYGAAPVNATTTSTPPAGQQPVYYQQDAVVLVGGQPGVQQQVPYAATAQPDMYHHSQQQQRQNYPLHRIWLMVYSFAIGAIGAYLYLWGIYGTDINWAVWFGAIGLGYTAVFGLIAAASKNRAMIALNLLGLGGMFTWALVLIIYSWIQAGSFETGYLITFGFCAVTAFTFAVAASLYQRITRDLRSRQEFEQSLIQGQPIMAGAGYHQVV